MGYSFSDHFYISQSYVFGQWAAKKKLTKQKQREASKCIRNTDDHQIGPQDTICTPLLLGEYSCYSDEQSKTLIGKK